MIDKLNKIKHEKLNDPTWSSFVSFLENEIHDSSESKVVQSFLELDSQSIKKFVSGLDSVDKLVSSIEKVEKVISSLSSEFNSLEICFEEYRNNSNSTCNIQETLKTIGNEIFGKIKNENKNHKTEMVGNSRPAAPKLVFFTPDSTLVGGESFDLLSKRMYFWFSVGLLYLSRPYLENHTFFKPSSGADYRWHTIFKVLPTYEQWKRSLSAYDDPNFILNDLCGIPLPPNYMPFMGVHPAPQLPQPTDILHFLGHDLAGGSGHYEFQMSNPFLKDKQEIGYKKNVVKVLDSMSKELEGCWKSKRNIMKKRYNSYMLSLPRIAAIIFGICLFFSLVSDSNNITACDEIEKVLKSMCGETELCKGMIFCTNYNNPQSVCIMTCPFPGQEIDWQTPGNTGQMMFCGLDGLWKGNLVRCRGYTEAK